jgi:serine/threonine protein kinase
MSIAERTHFGDWKILESLGQGGQGQVFKAQKTSQNQTDPATSLQEILPPIAHVHDAVHRQKLLERFVAVIRGIYSAENAPLGALKVLHPVSDVQASAKAVGRMSRELEALQGTSHPSLVKILDSDLNENWFVMEYFSRGTLSGHLARTRGDVFSTLLAFRSLVGAVSELHKSGYVHRDIKPDNIFLADDGRLVLGDFGLVINPSAATERLTDTYENVGSKEWMPGWALGMRMDEVQPTFDVFCLGKLFWAMLTGQPFLRLWYYSHQQFDVEQMFPAEPAMRWARRILENSVVEHEEDCLSNAGELLTKVDELIGALQVGGQFLGNNIPFRCRVCGIGQCSPQLPPDASDMPTVCTHCGHIERFSGPKTKPAWQ